jgi:hypothetical protein
MSDDSEQVAALIKELLIPNRESTPTINFPTRKEIEGRKAKRRRIRQELVQILHLHNRSPLSLLLNENLVDLIADY